MAKIFISHSSEDKKTIDVFKKLILNNGLGIKDDEIAYTSAVETGVPIGCNIQLHIKENIANCDFVFFMISESYKKSEICLNEMGAAWALGKRVFPILIENISFDSIGWLYKMTLCMTLNDDERLDELRDVFAKKYDSLAGTVVWNKNKKEFIETTTPIFTQSLLPVIIAEEIVEVGELGLLDYREMFDDSSALLINIMEDMTRQMYDFTESIQYETTAMQSISKNYNTIKAKTSAQNTGRHMLALSKVIEDNTPKFVSEFESVINYAIKIDEFPNIDQDILTTNKHAQKELVNAIKGTKMQFVEQIKSLKEMPNIESSFNASKRKLIASFEKLIVAYNSCILKANELLIQY